VNSIINKINRIKDSGEKVIGCFPLYPPLELFHSMDIIPVVLWGIDDVLAGVSESDKHLQNYVCSVARHLTEFVLTDGGRLLDGLFMYNACDTLRNLPEILECGLGEKDIKVPLFNIHIPAMYTGQTDSSGTSPAGAGGSFPKRDIPRLAESIQPPAGDEGFLQRDKYLQDEITGLVSKLEQEYGVAYSEKRFRESADLYREMRSLSLELDALVSSGMIGFGDFSRIIHEGYVVPVDVQIESLKSWIKNCGGAPPAGAEGSFPKRDIPRLAESIQPPAEAGGFLQRGNSPAGKKIPEDEHRVVVSGILPPPPSVCDIIEKSGFTVAGNDIASLYRSYCNHPEITGDAGKFYIDFYQNHFPCTTLLSTSDRRAEAIMNLIRKRNARGFIFIGEKFCEYEYFEIPFIDKMLRNEGINTLLLEFSIDDNENIEGFGTRIESFAEVMSG
jgi:benzoyl-CoA reductase/2-hydroxyglutaryl-CoA dehydratase subunit BcrC/BadD/HgdB